MEMEIVPTILPKTSFNVTLGSFKSKSRQDTVLEILDSSIKIMLLFLHSGSPL